MAKAAGKRSVSASNRGGKPEESGAAGPKAKVAAPTGGRRGRSAPLEPRSLADLRQDPRNARRHSDRNLDMIGESLRTVGAARGIVIDEEAIIRAGNGTVLAALKAGLSKLRIVDAAPDEMVAIRRSGLSKRQKELLSLFDNRAAEMGTWDPDALQALVDAGVPMDALFSKDELMALLATGHGRSGLTDPDDVPAARTTDIKPGDLFLLGDHRLLCGDSCSPAAVARLLADDKPRLMTADPPYGVEYDPAWRLGAGVSNTARVGVVANDERADWREAWALFDGDVAYVYHAGVQGRVVQESLEACDFELRAQIIWTKPRIVLSRGHYHWQHEPLFYAVRKGRQAHWAGSRKQSTAWAIAPDVLRCQSCGSLEVVAPAPEDLPSTVWNIDTKELQANQVVVTHGTQKPIECYARAMRNHLAPVIYDPFVGSGTSVIAAETLGRAVRGMELTPVYCQQTIDRWEAFTGKRAKKITGR